MAKVEQSVTVRWAVTDLTTDELDLLQAIIREADSHADNPAMFGLRRAFDVEMPALTIHPTPVDDDGPTEPYVRPPGGRQRPSTDGATPAPSSGKKPFIGT